MSGAGCRCARSEREDRAYRARVAAHGVLRRPNGERVVVVHRAGVACVVALAELGDDDLDLIAGECARCGGL